MDRLLMEELPYNGRKKQLRAVERKGAKNIEE